jgi:hypothetical protein
MVKKNDVIAIIVALLLVGVLAFGYCLVLFNRRLKPNPPSPPTPDGRVEGGIIHAGRGNRGNIHAGRGNRGNIHAGRGNRGNIHAGRGNGGNIHAGHR